MTTPLDSRYRLIEVVGRGAMGVVWRAQDVKLGRHVAVKELIAAPGVDAAEAADRFLIEAQAAACLAHPNIVNVHDVVSDGGRVFIVMELVDGPTLAQVVQRAGAQSPDVVRAVMAPADGTALVADLARRSPIRTHPETAERISPQDSVRRPGAGQGRPKENIGTAEDCADWIYERIVDAAEEAGVELSELDCSLLVSKLSDVESFYRRLRRLEARLEQPILSALDKAAMASAELLQTDGGVKVAAEWYRRYELLLERGDMSVFSVLLERYLGDNPGVAVFP